MAGLNGYHVDTRDLIILNNGDIYAGNDGGISKSTNSIDDWTNINGNGLILTQYWDMGSTNDKPEWIGGGTMDNAFSLYQDGQWQRTGSGDRANMGVNYESDTAFFIYSAIFGSPIPTSIKISKDGGASWTYNDIQLPDGHYNPPVEINHQRPRSVLLGGHNLYKSLSPYSSSYETIFVNINGDTGIIEQNQEIRAIEMANTDSNTIYVAFHWGVYDIWAPPNSLFKLIKTKNGGTTFRDIVNQNSSDTFGIAVNKLGITDILLSPTDTSKLWITLGGFDDPSSETDVRNRVFYSSDGALTFTDISAGLPNFPVNCIAYWNNGNDGLFVGMDIGVYYRDSTMTEWQPFNQELPKTIVMKLEILENEEIIRAATFGRGIYEADLSCEYSETPLVITSDTTWAEDVTMDRSIIVESPAIFTIKSEVKFPPQAKIKVKPGAELIVDGGTLTNTCFTMWQGIEAWGVSNLPQLPLSNQSLVVFSNNAVLKNARIGISNCGSYSNGGIIWDSIGGIIRTYNSTFTDNYKAIQILPTQYSNSESRFYNTTFTTSRSLVDGASYPSDLVSLYEVHGIWFYGCTFSNTAFTTNDSIPRNMKGNGIKSINSVFGIDRLCDEGSQPCANPDSTIFSGLNYGVYIANSDPSHNVTIRNSKFDTNYRSIYMNSADVSEITSNIFYVKVPSGIEQYDTTYGLYIGNSTGYHVEGNDFTCPGNSITPLGESYPMLRQIGLIVDNSGGHPNEIYRNYFDTLDIAINAQRVNRQDGAYPDEGEGVGQPEIHTGLVLKCNIYHNNSYDEMVTRENPTGVEGIAYYQGSPNPDSLIDLAGNLFSPYHETAQIAESDILNDGSIFYYFHHIQLAGQNPPRTKPEFCDTNVVKAREKVFYFDTTGCCPSRIESQGTPDELREQMYTEQQEIDLLQSEYLTLVDGGSTEELNTEVFMSLPPDAVSLHQELLNNSPYLSDTVMQTAIAKEDVLPNAMIRDILVANPQSAKSTGVLGELNNRFVPMPDPMMEEILAGQSLISDKEVLEGEIAWRKLRRQDLFYRLIRSYKADTVSEGSHDSLILLLQQEQSLRAKYLLAFEYLKTGDTANVTTTLNSIPNTFSLSNEQENLQNDYQDYFGVLASLKSENKSILELNTGQITVLQNLSATGREPVRSYARNILLANNLMQYYEPILLPDLTNYAPSKPFVIPDQIILDDYFKVFPNPAKYYVIIEYNLKEDFIAASGMSFKIYDASGKQIDQMYIHKQQDQFIIPVESYSPGVYLCCLYNKTKVVQSIRFTVIK